ncbi:MAG: NAD(P)-binding protein [Actinobacteria bacterium]|nr:NAD(P)-binding protein [Actinomycetota bacterium]MDI6830327.1 NAD(P)-binding protein [Actinomycetota bacterium]
MSKRVEIVGAGLAGLVAGINLARRGCEVRIHEGREYMGGDLSYADSTIMDVPALQAELGVEVEEALEPWTLTRAWAYGKKYEFGLPRGVEGFTVERGRGERSLENVLYRQALAEGVEVLLGSRLSKREIKELPPGSIVATGLDREAFEAMDLPCRPFFCHMATGRGDPSRPSVIIYLDSFTREFGYYFQRGEAAGALVFSVQRPLTDGEKEEFKSKLAVGDGIEFAGWNDGVAAWAAWPLGSWRNRCLLQGDKILAGTLAGLVSPVLLFGVNGALVSGKIAALAVTDRDAALREFRRLAPLYWPQFAFRKIREYAPHTLLRPVTRAILSTYDPDFLPWALLFVLWPPGFRYRSR